MAQRSGGVIWRVIATVVVIALVFVGMLAYVNRQLISDHFAASNFTASAEIHDLADRLELTDDGHRIFFATHPTIEASQRFNEQCRDVDHSEDGHILGCYTNGSIHLFAVTDERLQGIVEVTAAHELLHATYARLSDEERAILAERLTELYTELSAEDPELAERMSVYSGLSGSAFANELHSVLGTEQRVLPEWLDEHYARWFVDRSIIIDYFDSYHAVFVEIQQRADELQAELDSLRTSIETRSEAYSAALEQYSADVGSFNQRNANFEFDGREAEFYQELAVLQQREADLNAENASIRADIERYNTLREELEQLNAINQELNENLNSDLAPPAPPVGT